MLYVYLIGGALAIILLIVLINKLGMFGLVAIGAIIAYVLTQKPATA